MNHVTLGLTTDVEFVSFNKRVSGKVDTGATTSSLHATNIKQEGDQVTFQSPALSNNVITLPLAGTQEVHTADAGGNSRYVVALDVIIEGCNIDDAHFNLNDRSGMDADVLIGENILSTGQFTIDPTDNQDDVSESAVPTTPANVEVVRDAIKIILEQYPMIGDIIRDIISTEPVRGTD